MRVSRYVYVYVYKRVSWCLSIDYRMFGIKDKLTCVIPLVDRILQLYTSVQAYTRGCRHTRIGLVQCSVALGSGDLVQSWARLHETIKKARRILCTANNGTLMLQSCLQPRQTEIKKRQSQFLDTHIGLSKNGDITTDRLRDE